MRKLLTSSVVISLLSVASLSANANDYTVQIGAYQVLTNQAISNAEQHGEVYQSIGSDNLTRLHVGRFTSKVDAVNKRDQLRSSGYNDAFITQISVASSQASSSSSYEQTETSYDSTSYEPVEVTKGSYNSSSYTSSSSAPLSSGSRSLNSSHSKDRLSGLNADERSKAAFLDGQLRIQSNGQFLTLRQYREQTRQNNAY